ncbi:hypothetical protein A9G08_09830 [Gilliamella sp. wkB195]|nr:hypothetical protein A9G08_09830 [Gilliamella apicola]
MTNKLIVENPLYNKAQVCAYISIDDRTLDRWVSAAKFPKPDLYLGRHPRWKLSTVNAYLFQKEEQYQSCG